MTDIETVFDNNDGDNDQSRSDADDSGSDANGATAAFASANLVKQDRETLLLIEALERRLEPLKSKQDFREFAQELLRRNIINAKVNDEIKMLLDGLEGDGDEHDAVFEKIRTIIRKALKEYVPAKKLKKGPRLFPIPHAVEPDTLSNQKDPACEGAPYSPHLLHKKSTCEAPTDAQIQERLNEIKRARAKQEAEAEMQCAKEQEEELKAIEEIYRRTLAAGKPVRLDPNFRKITMADVDRIVEMYLNENVKDILDYS